MLAPAVLFTPMILAMLSLPPLMRRLSTHEVNRPAAEFTVSRLDGGMVNSADLKGRVVVLAVWATSPSPRRGELPGVERVYARYKMNPNVVLLAVDGPWLGDTVEKERDYVAKRGWELPFAFDTNNTLRRSLGDEFHIPALMLADKRGHIRLIHRGYDTSEHFAEHLTEKIDSLLRE